MMAALVAARDKLRLTPTLVAAALETPSRGSCEIGIEAGISPLAYPIIRLIPSRITQGVPYGKSTCQLLIRFGVPLADAEGMFAVYSSIFGFWDEIKAVIPSLEGGRILFTDTDLDTNPTYKAMEITAEVTSS